MLRIFSILIIITLFFSCNKSKKSISESQKKFEGYFWMVDKNNLTLVNEKEINPYDSSVFYLNKIKNANPKDYSNNIWKLRLFLKKGYYDSILINNKNIYQSDYEYNLFQGLAFELKKDSVNSNKRLKKALDQLECKNKSDDRCIIIQVLYSKNFDILEKNKKNSNFLNDAYNNSDKNISSLIEYLNLDFNNEFFIK